MIPSSPLFTSQKPTSYLILSIFHFPQKINHHNISCISLVIYMPTGFLIQSTIFAHIYYFNSILLVIRSTLQACARISFLKHNFDHFISLLRNHSMLFYNPKTIYNYIKRTQQALITAASVSTLPFTSNSMCKLYLTNSSIWNTSPTSKCLLTLEDFM